MRHKPTYVSAKYWLMKWWICHSNFWHICSLLSLQSKIRASLYLLQHILSGYWVCGWGIQYHLCSTYKGSGGCLAVVAQWQSTAGSRQRCPGFNSWWLLAFHLITSKFLAGIKLQAYLLCILYWDCLVFQVLKHLIYIHNTLTDVL